MDYLKQNEWKLNDELFAYLKQRVCYYEKAENTWFIRDFDEVNNRYSYKFVKDKHLYNTNIYVDTGIEKRKPLKSVIDMCLKQYLTVSHVDFIPYSSVHPAPQHIFNLYVDNNETFYDADLTVNHEYVKQFLFHIKEIICSNDEDVYKYVMSWIAHKIQRPDKKIETCLLLMSPDVTRKLRIYGSFGILTKSTIDIATSLSRINTFTIPISTWILASRSETR